VSNAEEQITENFSSIRITQIPFYFEKLGFMFCGITFLSFTGIASDIKCMPEERKINQRIITYSIV